MPSILFFYRVPDFASFYMGKVQTFSPFLLVFMLLTFNSFAQEGSDPSSSNSGESPILNQTQSQESLTLMVLKTPTCGCCKKWISHLEEEDVVAQSKDYERLDGIKTQLGIGPRYRSCHTALSREGLFFEGHVPAKYIELFLRQVKEGKHPNAIGLSVPAMPVGSPGMEMGDRFMPYQVLLLLKDGSHKVFARVSSYGEQF